MHASGMDGRAVLQAPPGASPTGGVAQLLSRTREPSLEGAEAGAGMAGLPGGVAEGEGVAGSPTCRLGRLCSPCNVYRASTCKRKGLIAPFL